MSGWRWLGCGLAVAGRLWAATGEPALPQWDDGDKELLKHGDLVPGSVLLGDPLPVAGEEVEEPKSEAAKLPPPPTEEEKLVAPVTEIPDEFLGDYFGQKPESFLVDPQKLLSRQEQRDRVGFLRYHSGDSAVDLYFYLFEGGQEIPGAVRAEELMERFFDKGKPAAVVFYFVGAPQRAELHLSPSLTGMVQPAERQRALQSSVAEALEKADPVDQLDRFSVQMSIRLYWMEKSMGGSRGDAGPLVEYPAKPAPAPKRKWWEPWLVKAQAWFLPAAGVGGVIGIGMLVTWLSGIRARYRFPEIEVTPRLGGAHGAGVGAVITFGNPSLPPSFQREQVPDYLRRM